MKDRGQKCPADLKLSESNSMRMCGKKTDGKSCNSVLIPTNGQSYQYVRGIIKAYQFGTPDAFKVSSTDIDDAYLDGISITHGQHPRKHVFSLAVGVAQYVGSGSPHGPFTCPNTGYGQPQPSFVADKYFCSSGAPGPDVGLTLYPDTPLWSDGANCDECSWPRVFCVNLSEPTTDDLELRVCTDEPLSNEDIRIEMMNLFIK